MITSAGVPSCDRKGIFVQSLLITLLLLAFRGHAQPEGAIDIEGLRSEARVLYKEGNYEDALPPALKAYQASVEVNGELSPGTFQCASTLANIHLKLNDHQAAEQYLLLCVKIDERLEGPDHPDTATSLSRLSNVYKGTKQYSKALPLRKRALSIRQKALGPNHPKTATSLNNLASLYHAMGHKEDAAAYYERALDVREKVLGQKHKRTLKTLDRLSTVYRELFFEHYNAGNYRRALPWMERLHEDRDRILGTKRTDRDFEIASLVVLYQRLEDYGLAIPLHRESLVAVEERYGAQHPLTAANLLNVALLYSDMGDHEMALGLLKRASSILEQSPENTESLADCLGRIASCYAHLNCRALTGP